MKKITVPIHGDRELIQKRSADFNKLVDIATRYGEDLYRLPVHSREGDNDGIAVFDDVAMRIGAGDVPGVRALSEKFSKTLQKHIDGVYLPHSAVEYLNDDQVGLLHGRTQPFAHDRYEATADAPKQENLSKPDFIAMARQRGLIIPSADFDPQAQSNGRTNNLKFGAGVAAVATALLTGSCLASGFPVGLGLSMSAVLAPLLGAASMLPHRENGDYIEEKRKTQQTPRQQVGEKLFRSIFNGEVDPTLMRATAAEETRETVRVTPPRALLDAEPVDAVPVSEKAPRYARTLKATLSAPGMSGPAF